MEHISVSSPMFTSPSKHNIGVNNLPVSQLLHFESWLKVTFGFCWRRIGTWTTTTKRRTMNGTSRCNASASNGWQSCHNSTSDRQSDSACGKTTNVRQQQRFRLKCTQTWRRWWRCGSRILRSARISLHIVRCGCFCCCCYVWGLGKVKIDF